MFLGFLGSETAEYPCVEFGTFATLVYFILPVIGMPLMLCTSIMYIHKSRAVYHI